MMKKISIGALLVALAVVMAGPAQAAFTVGGENGWQLSTDGIVNIFGAYQTQSGNDNAQGLLGAAGQQKFGVRVGLLPSIIAFNIKAPTTAGIESNVRAAMYVNVQNSGGPDASNGLSSGLNTHYNTAPNIDFREFFYTAKGKFGELLAGRALNLFQGQNILNDMTLFTAGVVDMTAVRGGTSLGHIGYGYLYANFGPQFRYTTPDMGGFKVALEVGEPYQITIDSGKQNVPRLEAELSYAATFKGGSIHAWLSGIEQTDTRSLSAAVRPGAHNISLGVSPGFNAQFGPVGIMASGYYGTGLGMVSTQDGDIFTQSTCDVFGNQRKFWGFLAQATYQVTDSIRLAANYGDNRSDRTDEEGDFGIHSGMKSQEAAVAQINWNLNKFTQFTLEYIWAKDTWQDHAQERSNQVALGTVFFW
ncbi:MAG TPA: hypothetical protein VHN12_12575 [Geobacteraceae bacterium]|nr:hypothetical protein [Geobacteraceae bacterium]